jgi:hypothetical protein
MGELNSADTRDDILDGPLLSQNIEKLETRRAYMDTARNRVGNNSAIQINKKSGVEKVGMVG